MIKTKIVITIGKQRENIYGADGLPIVGPLPHIKFFEMMKETDGNFIFDVVRLNMAHFEDGANELEIINSLRTIQSTLQSGQQDNFKYLSLLGDLPGPKVRISDILRLSDLSSDKVSLCGGAEFVLYWNKKRKASDPDGASVYVYDKLFSKVSEFNEVVKHVAKNIGDVIISLGDGQVVLHPKKINEEEQTIICTVVIPGEISKKSGLTIRGFDLPLKAFGKKDEERLDFLLKNADDLLSFVGVSFVKQRTDIENVKKHIFTFLRHKNPQWDEKRLR